MTYASECIEIYFVGKLVSCKQCKQKFNVQRIFFLQAVGKRASEMLTLNKSWTPQQLIWNL